MDKQNGGFNIRALIKYGLIGGITIFALVSITWNTYAIDKYIDGLTKFYSICPETQNCDKKENIRHQRRKLDELNLRREIEDAKIVKRFQDMFDVVNGKLNKFETEFQKYNVGLEEQVQHTRKDIVQLRNNIWADTVSHGTKWRKAELAKLTNLIQTRIYNLQHPSDCKKAKKITCVTNDWQCGFGCQIHSISYCLIVAYSKKRVMLPVFDKWSYSTKGWNEHFQPLTNCTLNDKSDEPENNTAGEDSQDIITVPFYHFPLATLPPAFPTEFANTLIDLHPNPPVYWIGQFMTYIMRYNSSLQEYVDEKARTLNFSQPIVGIQVRRTDKKPEAEYFDIDEYMKHVSAWYDLHTMPNSKTNETRLVYLVTDEPEVINETLTKYPEYKFIFDYEAAVKAKQSRWTSSSMQDIVTSLHLLWNCEYVVCTHSSNICRFVYEMISVTNFTNEVLSLDTTYYYYGQHRDHQIAVIEHRPADFETEEIELDVGDVLEVKIPGLRAWQNKNNQFDGLTEGRNLRTTKYGKWPTYKVKEKWLVLDFPKYP